MKIVIIQHDIVWASPHENRQHLTDVLENAPQADLYVLAEMWSTGFATNPEGVAERDGASLEWMRQMARKRNAAIAGSLAVEEDGKYYNRLYFVKPSGEEEHYDKRHLFTYSGEDKQFTRGSRRVVAEWRGVRFLLAVCYDLRFPVWSRNLGDYDALLYVASWPTSRVEAWRALLRARAIENQCYVAAVNRVGSDPSCTYCGGSALIDPYGHTIAECADNQEGLEQAQIDMEALQAFRKKFPVLNDGDKFIMEK